MAEGHTLHEGHRQRLRKKFRLGALEEHEFLEMVLGYGIPRRNTNDIAHRLLDRFGSLYGVLNADEKLLLQVEGIGENAAVFLKAMAELVARYRRGEVRNSDLLKNREALEIYATSLFIGSKSEKVFALLFGANGRLLGCECLAEGFAAATGFLPGQLVRMATAAGACSVILTHNHPEGTPQPSETDIASTYRLQAALEQVGIRLRDHVIVAEDECQSVLTYMSEREGTR